MCNTTSYYNFSHHCQLVLLTEYLTYIFIFLLGLDCNCICIILLFLFLLFYCLFFYCLLFYCDANSGTIISFGINKVVSLKKMYIKLKVQIWLVSPNTASSNRLAVPQNPIGATFMIATLGYAVLCYDMLCYDMLCYYRPCNLQSGRKMYAHNTFHRQEATECFTE